MKKRFIQTVLFIILGFVGVSNAQTSEDITVGLFDFDVRGAYPGYTLFNSLVGTDTYLIDNCGRVVNRWSSDLFPGNGVYLLENGNLLKTSKTSSDVNPNFIFGGAGEMVQLIDWNNNVLWEYTYSNEDHRMHHDVAILPNGNVLILAWESFTREEAIQAGRNPDLLPDDELWGEHIVEVDPNTDEIVWEWHMMDHVVQDFDDTKDNYGVIADHPELLDLNFVSGPSSSGQKNWLQMNSIFYHEAMDQIMLSSNFLSEIYVIDHSTTTAQAASHNGGQSGSGGDILYRWGNPQVYDHGTADDQKLFRQHTAYWIEKGIPGGEKIMVFNNGNGRPEGNYSSVEILTPEMDDYLAGTYIYVNGQAYGPSTTDWTYSAPDPFDFYTSFIGGAQRLPNGNTLICEGQNGRLFEIDENNEIVWQYVNPSIDTGPMTQGDEIPKVNGRNANITFRAVRYPLDYEGFKDLSESDLQAGDPIELNFIDNECSTILSIEDDRFDSSIEMFPNPARNFIKLKALFSINEVHIYSMSGNILYQNDYNGREVNIDISGLERGVYFIKINNSLRKFLVTK